MNWDAIKEAATWTTGIVGVISIAVYGGYQIKEREADFKCYEELSIYNSWPTVRPIVERAAQDRFISIRECENMAAAYDIAKTREDREKYFDQFEAVKRQNLNSNTP